MEVKDTTCRDIRRSWESEGAASREAASHLLVCASCRAHATLLAVLARAETGEAGTAAVARVMEGLPSAPWQRRRVATWLPFAAGLALVGSGFAVLGGVPAPAAVAELPGVAGGFMAWLGSSILDALAAARGGSDAVRVALAAEGPLLVFWAALTAVGGGLAVRALSRAAVGGRG